MIKVATDDEIHLNHTMFDEPTVGSVELLHEYDQLWAEVLDETNQSLSGESMMTAQPGWDSEQEERDSFVKATSHEETMQAKQFLHKPVGTRLCDELLTSIDDYMECGSRSAKRGGKLRGCGSRSGQ